MKEKLFDQLFAEAESRKTYWKELAIIEFTEDVCRCMDEAGITRADLARQLGKSAPFVTRLLNGRNNFTIETMVDVVRALGGELRIHVQPAGARSQWLDLWDNVSVPAKDEPPCQPGEYKRVATVPVQTITEGVADAPIPAAA